jgi:hypothetical protein
LRREIRERLAQMQQAQAAGAASPAGTGTRPFGPAAGRARDDAGVIDGDFIRDVEEPPTR